MHFYLLSYLLAWLLTCFLPYFLLIQYQFHIQENVVNVDWKFLQNHTWKINYILTGNIPKKNIKVNFRFHNETYVLLMFHIQINISCNKYIIVVVVFFSQFKPMCALKNLEIAPALVLTQLRHCLYQCIRHFKTGCLFRHISALEEITSDQEVLQTGMKVELEGSTLEVGCSGFEIPKNQILIQEKVNKLLKKGVVVECEHNCCRVYFTHFLKEKDRWHLKTNP